MLPFSLELQPGRSVYQQVIYAVEKAVVSGRLRPGDRFPSVRSLSRELRINPNTAHKVVAALVADGLLEVRPGIGTTVAETPRSSAAERRALLAGPVEHLVVEAKKLRLGLGDVTEALNEHWERLSADDSPDPSDTSAGRATPRGATRSGAKETP
jgi:GntR family transcriptional regulator